MMSDTPRQSSRLGGTARPNFRDMCAGRIVQEETSLLSGGSGHPGGVGVASTSMPKIGVFWEGFRFTLYEEVMRRIRAYEQVAGCRLNASMITLKSRQGRPDYLYFRQLTFWCSHCIVGGKSSQSPSLAFDQRLCPFLAVVVGDEASESLILSQIFAQHRHLDHPSSEVKLPVANPRLLPALLAAAAEEEEQEANNKRRTPSSLRSSLKPQNGSRTDPRKRHSIVSTRRSVQASQKTPFNGNRAISKIATPNISLRKRPHSQSSLSNSISESAKKSKVAKKSNSKHSSNESTSDKSEIDDYMGEATCQMCSFKSTSKNAFCGHCWLAHKHIVDIITTW